MISGPIADIRKFEVKKVESWKTEFKNHKYLITLSIIFLIISLLINVLVGNYTNRAETSTVNDLILDHFGPMNLSYLFLYGYAAVLLFLGLYPLIYDVKRFHVAISQFSLLILIRSFFISLTHLKLPADAIIVFAPKLYNLLIFQNDLFFSAHTAVPFLGFLMFRGTKAGWFFLISTFVLAGTVLLMHVHYSIDVFAAIFISYGSYKFGEWFFKSINHH